MGIGGIGGIGRGGGGYIATGSPSPGGPGDDGPNNIGKKKAEKKKESDAAAELDLSSSAEKIAELEQMTHDALAAISPETLSIITAEHAIMTDPALQARMAEIRRKITIVRGARVYGVNQYPLPIEPVEPVTPVNPDPLPQADIETDEEGKDDEKSDQS